MSVPYCDQPWSEIMPGLFMGGHDYLAADGSIQNVIVGGEFDLVLSFYERYGCGPNAGVQRRYARIPDGILQVDELATVRRFADLAVEALGNRLAVLCRCRAGYNRSGLLAAFVLLRHGLTAEQAIDRIRTQRSPHALCNESFVTLIADEALRLERAA